jgi:hypothetical protein
VVDPSRVSVLAVGIERYASESHLPTLSGVAKQAVDFARWARDQGVPPERIRVAVSRATSQRLPRLRGVRIGRAEQADLEKAVVELAEQSGELLLVFWCGHGIVRDNRRLLFTADANNQHLRGMDAEDVLSYLRSDRMRSFAQQVVLVDACANYTEEYDPEGKWQELAQPGRLPKGVGRRGVEQQVLFSAAQGQAAKFDKGEQSALFAGILLEWLGHHGWPLDFRALHQHVTEQLEEYRAAGKTRQRPVSLWYRGADGNIDDRSYGGTPISAAAQTGIREGGLTVAQAHRVAGAIADGVLGESEEGRRHLLSVLGAADTAVAADRSSVLVAAVKQIAAGGGEAAVKALVGSATDEAERLSAYAAMSVLRRQRWIAVPLAAFPEIRGEQVRMAYYRSVPSGDTGHAPQDLDEAMDRAAAYGAESGRVAVLHRFVAHLEHLAGKQVEDPWFNLPGDSLHRLRGDAAPTSDELARLVIDLRPQDRVAGGQEWPAAVDGHLSLPGIGWQKTTITTSGTLDGAREATRLLRAWAYGKGFDEFTVGLILTRRQLDQVPESWEFGDDMYEPAPLWTDQPTIVHSAERLSHPQAVTFWRNRAEAIRKHVADHLPEVFWIPRQDQAAPVRIRHGVRDSKPGCVALGFVAGPCPPELRLDPIIAAIGGGAPYVIWVDSEPADWRVLKQMVKALTENGKFGELPGRLHKERGGPDLGLRVIWDAPEALPPLGPLTELPTEGRQSV